MTSSDPPESRTLTWHAHGRDLGRGLFDRGFFAPSGRHLRSNRRDVDAALGRGVRDRVGDRDRARDRSTSRNRIAADTLTAMPAANIHKPLRVAPIVRAMTTPPLAWSKLAQTGTWHAEWDAATGVPRQIWGSGIAAPGANADPAIAESVARRVLAEQIGLLAPGASASDFVMVSNSTDGDLRSIGFVQTARRRAGRRRPGELSVQARSAVRDGVAGAAVRRRESTEDAARHDRARVARDRRAATGARVAERAGVRARAGRDLAARRRRRRARLPARHADDDRRRRRRPLSRVHRSEPRRT